MDPLVGCVEFRARARGAATMVAPVFLSVVLMRVLIEWRG